MVFIDVLTLSSKPEPLSVVEIACTLTDPSTILIKYADAVKIYFHIVKDMWLNRAQVGCSYSLVVLATLTTIVL